MRRWFFVAAILGFAQAGPAQADEYDVVLRSSSPAEQRTALTEILRRPQDYVQRIQQTLRDYPKAVLRDRTAANRAIHVATLVRDPSFPPVLVGMLGDAAVIDECIYACPVVFALTVHACFAGWTPPSTLDAKLDTVRALQNAIRYVSKTDLRPRPIETLVQGPAVDRHRNEIEGKSEEELIHMAGPVSPPRAPRWLAAFALQASVATSKNRIALYVLLLNDLEADASDEYRGSIYQAIYRAETAKARGR